MGKTQLIIPYSGPDEEIRDKPTSTHHRYERCWGGVDDPPNTVQRYQKFHEAYHTVFGNLKPHETLSRILELNAPILTKQYKHEIEKVLTDDERYIYVNGIYRRKR